MNPKKPVKSRSKSDRPPEVRVEIAPSKLAEIKRDKESVRLMAIGLRRGITRLIHTLHNLGFAEAKAWSRIMPAPTPGEFMSVLTWNVWLEKDS